MKKEVKTNNKGFSLVELIVVVAIMAVLMVVLAPAMLRYVEKTRAGKDDSAAGEVREALTLALGDNDIYETITDNSINVFYVTIDENGDVALEDLAADKGGDEVLKEIKSTVGTNKAGNVGIDLSSKERKKSGSKCYIQAKYDDARQAYVVKYMDAQGKQTDKIAWDGIKETATP